MEQEDYPGVFDRVKAVIIDSCVLLLFMMGTTYLFSIVDDIPDSTRMIAVLIIFVLYDPICTSTFGGTVGHLLMGIRVKREKNRDKNILFPLAIVRFLLKSLLSWISLLIISTNDKRQALHDMVVKSVVIYK